MEGSDGLLQCVGRLEIASPKPVGFLCGTIPVLADAASFSLPRSALLPPTSQPMAAPRYQMLPSETDLNTLPLLHNIPEKVFPASAKTGLLWENGPVTHHLSRKCEALAVSGLTEYGDEIDVVAPTDIMKQIFKIPYSKARLSIAVHRIGDTLILNTGPDVEEGEKMFRGQSSLSKSCEPSMFLNFAMHSVRAEACDCPPSHCPELKSQGSTILRGQFGHEEEEFVSSPSARISKTQFLAQSENDCHNRFSKGGHDKDFWNAKKKQHKKRNDPIKKTSIVGEKTRCSVQETDKCKRVGNNGFLRVLFWQFQNFRMLLGSDLLVFSNEKYVAVSLHLWDVARQVTPLTWLEAWLDNVMASVPELAICYHENGVVQGYELLKTDDVFLLKGVSEDGTPAFHPQVVQQNGLSVLRFLQDNCKQDPGTYWLYKSAGEDVIQLFDLSVIPKGSSPTNHDSGPCPLSSLIHNGRKNSLFSLGTLLYRIAHRMSLSKSSDNKAKCAGFFRKCLDIMGDQDHLVVRAYAHEQFARLILNYHDNLDLTLESFLLESEATVTDVKDEDSVPSGEILGSSPDDQVSSRVTYDDKATGEGKMDAQISASEVFLPLDMEAILTVPRSMGNLGASENGTPISTSGMKDGLAMCQVSPSATPVCLVQTITDPISSRLAAVHHVSQAIKTLRWKRQLQVTEGKLMDNVSKIHERSPTSSFAVCACGDTDCIEVCDIREWLPKSRMDVKMWKLVLLLGESYLALGEAYRDHGQLEKALNVVKLACSIYGSMPQQFEGSQFISSMTCWSSSQISFKEECNKTDLSVDSLNDLNPSLRQKYSLSSNLPSRYLFWAKAWMLVGDVYVEYHRMEDKAITGKTEGKRIDPGLRLSEEVVREVKRLKKRLSQYDDNCSTCSLINCSCKSDRASSGNSASSSIDISSVAVGRKKKKNSAIGNSKHLSFSNAENEIKTDHLGSEKLQITNLRDRDPDCFISVSSKDEESTVPAHHTEYGVDSVSDHEGKDVHEVKYGGIFKFLEGPDVQDSEHNLIAALDCYDAAKNATNGDTIDSEELLSIVKKKGWVYNELGRHRLKKGDLNSAELAFSDAIKIFRKVSDYTNIVLINCNLGHGRRAMAEQMVSKLEMLKDHGYAYKQLMKTAKIEYIRSLKYYEAANFELNDMTRETDSLLRNEVHTQFAHTYLRFGMLLSKEDISTDTHGKESEGPPLGHARNTERAKLRKHEMSTTDAFGKALAIYESLGELRRQEAAFAHFQLACYHRDFSLKYISTDSRQAKHPNIERMHASLAEKHWQKSLSFYGPQTHPLMYLNILLELSTLLLSLSVSFDSPTMLESALLHLLEGRHAVREEDLLGGQEIEVREKFWNHLQTLLKRMLVAALRGGTNGTQSHGHTGSAEYAAKIKEMYRMSLKSASLCQLHSVYRMWISSS